MARPFLPLLLALLPTIKAQQAGCSSNTPLPLPAQTIAQFPPGNNFTFLENIAARPNGDLLVTMAVPYPTVYLVQHPNAAECGPATLQPLFVAPGVNGTDGIAEIATKPDAFAVVAGNLSLSGNPANGVPKTWSIFEVTLTDAPAAFKGQCKTPPPVVIARKVADLPQAPRLNGLAAIPGSSAVLVGDSQLGVVFRVDTDTGAVATVMDFPEMKPMPNAGSIDDALGLNGIRVGGDRFLYFTNAAARTVNRVAMRPDGTGAVEGAAVERLASMPGAGWLDDLAVRADGSLWVTTNAPTNSLLTLQQTVANQTGAQAQFQAPIVAAGANNTLTLSGPTAAVFGRGSVPDTMLFIACGSGDEPAKIVRVDTSACR